MVKKRTKKQEKALAAANKIKEREELAKRKEMEKKYASKARRKELVSEGVTPITLDDDVSEVGDNDIEWECAEWEAVDRAADFKTAKANFKIITGKRSGEGEAAKMWMWGR